MSNEVIFFSCFIAFVVLLLSLDLGVFHKKDHVIGTKEAAIWTCIWIGTGLLFWVFLMFHANLVHDVTDLDHIRELNARHGHGLLLDNVTYEEGLQMYKKAMSLEFITGYLIEKALSVDNIFVMIMIFTAFGVDKRYYHRVLFFGILGAIIMRFVFIFTASALIQKFHWILLLFGGVLVYTGVKMFIERNQEETMDVESHPVVRFFSKRKLSTSSYYGHDFFHKIDHRWLCTPLFLVLLVIEGSDVIFAFDSIPAIFAVTQDPYIVFFSNIFAILGLRSLFFLLESIMDKFIYLKIGLSVLLAFIGVKMIIPFVFAGIHISTPVSLMVILGILTISIVSSILFPPKKEQL